MLDALAGVFGTLFGFLSGILPGNPFSEVVQATESMRTGLAWLNWLCPIGEMLALMRLWIGVTVAVVAVRIALRTGADVGSNLVKV